MLNTEKLHAVCQRRPPDSRYGNRHIRTQGRLHGAVKRGRCLLNLFSSTTLYLHLGGSEDVLLLYAGIN